MLLLFCLAVSSSGLVIFIDHNKAPRCENIPLAERTESAMETQSIVFFCGIHCHFVLPFAAMESLPCEMELSRLWQSSKGDAAAIDLSLV